MFGQKKGQEARENTFAASSMGLLTDFWQQREEAEFESVDDVLVHSVRFCAQNNDRLVPICPGCTESYVKHAEMAYDLFHNGFDVMIIGHRGQGCSGRLLSDTHRGHVVNFSDYVDDLAALWQQQVVLGHWQGRFILAHSMGGAIIMFLLQRHQVYCDVTAPCAPMFGIIIRLPNWVVYHILDRAESYQCIREEYVISARCWWALSFVISVPTHSQQRYHHDLRFCADEPRLQVDGPAWYRVQGGMLAGDEVLANVEENTASTLLLQAEEKRVVDNLVYDRCCELRAVAGHPCKGGKLLITEGAHHEILFEKDAMCSVTLNAIIELFNRRT